MKMLSPKLIKLISLLNDTPQTVEQLNQALGIGRSAVCQMIKKLQDYGISIETHKSESYRLPKSLQLLDPKIIHQLNSPAVDLFVYEQLNSTNDQAKQLPYTNKPIVVLAEQQTAGRGRLGRSWHSPFAENIMLTYLQQMTCEIGELSGLSLVVGLSTLKTLQAIAPNLPLQVKWPNDVLCDQHKIAGVLIELQTNHQGHCCVVIGIGININMQETTSHINQAWTSLAKQTHQYYNRNPIVTRLLDQLQTDLALFQQQGFAPFQAVWRKWDAYIGKLITINTGAEKIPVEALGITVTGQLKARLADGSQQTFSCGEINQ